MDKNGKTEPNRFSNWRQKFSLKWAQSSSLQRTLSGHQRRLNYPIAFVRNWNRMRDRNGIIMAVFLTTFGHFWANLWRKTDKRVYFNAQCLFASVDKLKKKIWETQAISSSNRKSDFCGHILKYSLMYLYNSANISINKKRAYSNHLWMALYFMIEVFQQFQKYFSTFSMFANS